MTDSALSPTVADVPSPIDLQDPRAAAEWASQAMQRRPSRVEFFDRFAKELAQGQGQGQGSHATRVLELGSGPGFLAEHLLTGLPNLTLDLFDFSRAMHDLARQRLGPLVSRVGFIHGSFKEPGWTWGLSDYDFVITHQAVHEIRHKRHVPALHAQVRNILAPGGIYLVCDHFVGEGGMSDDQLYMTREEQRDALLAAGFADVRELMCKGGLALYRAA